MSANAKLLVRGLHEVKALLAADRAALDAAARELRAMVAACSEGHLTTRALALIEAAQCLNNGARPSLLIECGIKTLTLRAGDGLRLDLSDDSVHIFRDDDTPALLRGQIPAAVTWSTDGLKGGGDA